MRFEIEFINYGTLKKLIAQLEAVREGNPRPVIEDNTILQLSFIDNGELSYYQITDESGDHIYSKVFI